MAACCVSGLVSQAHAACPQDVAWPEPDWAVEPLGQSAAQTAFEDYLFTLVGADEDRLGVRTDGVVVVHRGRIIYERYARGYAQHKRHLTWSVSKSIHNALVGVAVMRGDLGVEDSVCDYYPVDADACDMTVDDLLSFGSGYDWNEGYEDDPYYLSSVIAMLYGVGSRDMARFVAGHELAYEPGTVYRYSSGDSVLLSAVLEGALPESLRASHPWEFLFDPIGMDSAVFERDQAGTFVGSSYAYTTPRDMARLGYLFLRDGCWEGQQLLPEGWVAFSTAPNPAFLSERSFEWARDDDASAGRHWWINAPIPELMIDSRWPSAPPDTYAALGHWGQTIFVIPSEDLVVVRTADDRETGAFDKDRYLGLALGLAAEDLP
ncbi:Beta-lactamase class C [Enhygromyxa salina]|uniref:Beta-lactamase class C n=1 Tax=Enhygromyxa salina TaxID=215803 RepID=A0A0C2D001_9BACT|nr:Beta-lactamase class C [Enhygromyxa salina]